MSQHKEKKRLDVLLVEKELFETRQKAQTAIMSGNVFVNDKKETKAGTQISPEAKIDLKGNALPYVSRGGLKLEKALKSFNLDINNAICLDAGASSGGFTDCLLQNGAATVYAIDVGYGQLDWKIRNDHRVKVFERTNIRYLTPQDLYKEQKEQKATICVADLSFISITKVLKNILTLMDKEQHLIILIKPQFEAGKNQVPKTGVIKDKKLHEEIITTIFNFCNTLNLRPINLTHSPIKGPSGNIEYLAYLTNCALETLTGEDIIKNVVNTAHQELK